MRKELIFPLLFIVIEQIGSFGQSTQTGQYTSSDYYSNLLPKSAEVATLGKFGNMPINYFTGLPEISLPLMTLTSRDLSLPISLNYDASGVKTDELSGQVGLKWHLNAGGFITRDMNGLPDEHPTLGYWKYALETDYWNNISNVSDWVVHSEKNTRDTSPDEFTIFINGRSIRFVFDKYKRAVPIPRQNIKVSHSMLNNKINKFEVTLEDGTRYIFGGDVSSVGERKIENLNMKVRFKWTAAVEWDGYNVGHNWYYTGRETFDNANENEIKTIDFFNSKWYLKQIVSVTGDVITFNYVKGSDVKYTARPSLIRFKPVMATMGTYTTQYEHCSEWILWWCNNKITFVWTHPSPYGDGWSPHPSTRVSDSYNLIAIRKFGATNPGSDPEFLNYEFLPQSETSKFFKPESYPARPGGVFANHTLITESNIRLNSINAATGNKITFVTSSRQDLPNAVKYDRIYLQDMNNVYAKSIKLNYSTVEPDDNDPQNNDFFWISEAITMRKISTLVQSTTSYYAHFAKAYNESAVSDATLRKFVFEGLKGYNFKRLFLESVVDETGGLNLPLHEFEYESRHLLKRRTTPLVDKYGFSRNSSAAEKDFDLHSGKKAKIINSYSPASVSGTRVPIRGMLTKIKYPTKGYTEFQFSTFSSGSGLRIEFVKDFDESMNLINQRQVQYLDATDQGGSIKNVTYTEHKVSGNDWMKQRVESSSPQNGSPYRGPLIMNAHVRVYNGTSTNSSGYEEFRFTASKSPAVEGIDSQDKITPIYASPQDVNANGAITVLNSYVFPYPRKYERDYLRGMLLEYSIHDNTGFCIKRLKNSYKENPYNHSPITIQGFAGGSFVWTGSENRRRYGKYVIKPNWVILEKATETYYDKDNLSVSLATVTEYVYDPLNLQMIETQQYNPMDPANRTITKTKYATHSDYNFNPIDNGYCQQQYQDCMYWCEFEPDSQVRFYCQVDCSNQLSACENTPQVIGAPETEAIITLKDNHQISTPVEIQGLVQDNGVEKLISAVVYKYSKEGSPAVFVKPKSIWGMKQTIDPGTFQSTNIDQDGNFLADNRLRLLHTFNSYQQNTGNLLQQTSLDGISTAYTWGHNNSLVTGFTVNPGGGLQQSFQYDHKLLVGISSVTDQNSIKYYYDYDRLNRLKLEKDHNGNITTRYRYHYKTSRGFNMTISGPNNGTIGQAVSFSSYEDLEYGQTSHEWNMGDGTIKTSSIANHVYQVPGNYTVTLKKANPEYGSVTLTKNIQVRNPGFVQIYASGETYIDLCYYSYGSTTLNASVINGCPPYSFTWEYRYNGGPWTYYAAGSPVYPPPGFGYQEGYWEVRCIAYSGECGEQITSDPIWLYAYRSDPNCFGNQY